MCFMCKFKRTNPTPEQMALVEPLFLAVLEALEAASSPEASEEQYQAGLNKLADHAETEQNIDPDTEEAIDAVLSLLGEGAKVVSVKRINLSDINKEATKVDNVVPIGKKTLH